ncbi:MAG: eukaryotic-like serine/threonine-protein kinase, partial [Kribbellaceae bacterium]|nr:eukaryotic-like serine/threonine-protein kinase [Kribbellaceae bacterium]
MRSEESEGRLLAGRYRLLGLLGRGGMGVVWHGRDEVLGREVAIKEIVLPAELPDAERDVLRRRTLREARSAARLSDPNVVAVYDVVEEEGRPWIVMEFVKSRTLADAVREDGPLPFRQVARIGLQVLGALEAAHPAGVLHRDVKPSNVLLADDGRVVLTDFGIATLEGETALTQSGTLVGSPAYIAPERVQARGAGPESDLWSLGATLYTAVEGRPPYDRDTPLITLTAAVTEPPDPPKLAGPLWPALEGLLRKDPATRLDAPATRRLLLRAATPAPRPAPKPAPASRSEAAAPSSPAPAQPGATPSSPAPAPPPGATPSSPAPAQPGATPSSPTTAPRQPAAVSDHGQGTRVLSVPAVVPESQGPAASSARSAPVVPPAPPAGPAKSSSSWLPKALVPLVVCALLAAGVWAWAAFGPDDNKQSQQPGADNSSVPSTQAPRGTPTASGKSRTPQSSAPSSPPSTVPSGRPPSRTTQPTQPTIRPTTQPSGALPAGFERHNDPTGFSLAVPSNWTVRRENGRVYFREPGGSRLLLIDQTDQPKAD